jgi:hypothetical protein
MDATNPIADEPPTNGVLPFFTSYNESLMERLQREFPAIHFVKAFNSVDSGLMVNPELNFWRGARGPGCREYGRGTEPAGVTAASRYYNHWRTERTCRQIHTRMLVVLPETGKHNGASSFVADLSANQLLPLTQGIHRNQQRHFSKRR